MNDEFLNSDPISNMPRVNPFEYPEIECDECKCKDWMPVMRFRKVPGLLVGEKEDIYYPHKIFVCRNCGKISPVSQQEIDEIMKITPNAKPKEQSSLII